MPLSYNNNVPQASDKVANTQAPILTNFQSIDSAFNDTGNGNFTKYVIQNVGTPTGGAPVNPLSILHTANDAASNPQLFFRNSLADIQITSNTNGGGPSAMANGYSFLPGGIIIQWGVFQPIGSTGTKTVPFPFAFPTACFSVVCTPVKTTPNTSSGFTINGVASVMVNQFQVRIEGSNPPDALYFIAIGN